MKIHKGLIISVLGLLLSYPYINNDYTRDKKIEAQVINKEERDVHKRGMWGKEYYIIYRLQDNHKLWKETNPRAYASQVMGERHTLTLSEMDIKQTGWNNFLFFIGPCLLISFSLTGILMFTVFIPLFNDD